MSSQPSYIAEPPKQVSLPNDPMTGGGSNPKKDIILGLGFLLEFGWPYEVPINHVYRSPISAIYMGLLLLKLSSNYPLYHPYLIRTPQ